LLEGIKRLTIQKFNLNIKKIFEIKIPSQNLPIELPHIINYPYGIQSPANILSLPLGFLSPPTKSQFPCTILSYACLPFSQIS